MFKTFHNEETIILGKWTKEELDSLLYESSQIKDVGKRIEFLSIQFMDLDYKESTLTGNINTPEVFVINLEGVDCFTYIDYIEAMRLSRSFSKFKLNLRKIRYKSGKVAFENRNHFFTDWREFNSDFIQDVTKKIGSKKTVRVQKMLNEKEDGTYFLIGINPAQREIKYIPSDAIDDSVINKMRIGDYVGIYSHLAGLDVSHVGIVVKDRERIFLRHASSQKTQRKVVDQDFKKYIANKPGIIVLRPNPHYS
ncbi:MAG: hypothetical protein A2Z47_00620 [Thermodesulfovibrio sp. RBG_19FT_COMBO_42_12]|nr:MAG: hypothetical protein A2Z47_00620 [Thermodesulfovibrio sp. RBG_19FT_COMBO_42_12]